VTIGAEKLPAVMREFAFNEMLGHLFAFEASSTIFKKSWNGWG
jgi:hypothetical protein